MVISSHQLNAVMRKAAGLSASFPAFDEPSEFLTAACDAGRLRLPFDPSVVFWIKERLPVYSEMQRTLERSALLSQLSMRTDDTGLVVDSLLKGADAVHFATVTKKWATVDEWIRVSCPSTSWITIKSIDDEYVLVLAKFKTFVVPGSSD